MLHNFKLVHRWAGTGACFYKNVWKYDACVRVYVTTNRVLSWPIKADHYNDYDKSQSIHHYTEQKERTLKERR